jgi:hypothetical protein
VLANGTTPPSGRSANPASSSCIDPVAALSMVRR